MFKKGLTVLSVAILSLLATNTAFAYTQESYSKQVKVEVHNASSTSLNLTGVYKLENLTTNEMFFSLPNTPITFSQVNGEVSIYQVGATMYSANGFALHALSGNEKMVVFTADVEGRKGASADYEVVKAYKAFQGAYFINEFTNVNGELWYSIRDEQGVASWVPAKNTSIGSVVSQPLGKTPSGTQYRSSFNVVKSGTNVQIVNRLDLENYLKGVIPNESYASWHIEALKSQAVAARSYTLSKAGILSNTTKDQMYKGYSSEQKSTNLAVEETNGLVIKSGGKLVQAYYYSASGGRTANIGEAWDTAQVPHFVSVDDSIEKSPYSNWSVIIPASNILKKFGFNPSSDQLLDVKLTKGGSNGEVTAVTIVTSSGEKTIKGNETVMRGVFLDEKNASLKSNWFDINFTKPSEVTDIAVQHTNGSTPVTSLTDMSVQTATGTATIPSGSVTIQTNEGIVSTSTNVTTGIQSITVNGKGNGHRIGMSQYGAKARADAGWTYDNILKHYYQGVTIEKY